jgi:hypothetical protein
MGNEGVADNSDSSLARRRTQSGDREKHAMIKNRGDVCWQATVMT